MSDEKQKRLRGGNSGIPGPRVGSVRWTAGIRGRSPSTNYRAKRRAKALGVGMLDRLTRLKQFNKPAAIDALIALPDDERERVIALAEAGGNPFPRTPRITDPLEKCQSHLSKLETKLARDIVETSHDEREELFAEIKAMVERLRARPTILDVMLSLSKAERDDEHD